MSRTMSRPMSRVIVPLLLALAALADWLWPVTQQPVSSAFLIPVLAALAGAVANRPKRDPRAEYGALSEQEWAKYAANVQRGNQAGRINFLNAVANAKGFNLPGRENLAANVAVPNLPPPQFKSGGLLDVIGGAAGGAAAGYLAERNPNDQPPDTDPDNPTSPFYTDTSQVRLNPSLVSPDSNPFLDYIRQQQRIGAF